MNVSGEFTVNAPRDVVFNTLRDPNSFVRFVDGVSDLKELDPTHYEAVFGGETRRFRRRRDRVFGTKLEHQRSLDSDGRHLSDRSGIPA